LGIEFNVEKSDIDPTSFTVFIFNFTLSKRACGFNTFVQQNPLLKNSADINAMDERRKTDLFETIDYINEIIRMYKMAIFRKQATNQ
jgi:hypothetical protein